MTNGSHTIKNLYCIEYPGNVQNEERMMETLGGIETISNAFAADSNKLECKFRPEDFFCKGITGEQSQSFNFLIKVRVKKTKQTNDKPECTTSIVGRVRKTIKFTNLNDFQYLPVEKENDKLTDLLENLIPSSMVPMTWLEEPLPSYLPPPLFARIDSVQPYLVSKISDAPGSVMGRLRDRRSNYVKFVSYNCEQVPDSPNPNTLRYVKLKLVTEEQILKMKELFEKRPVWTRNGLYVETKFSEVQLKYLLALSSYHFTSGPFRIAWVRFGYDPRKDPEARKYQIIDYRIKDKVQQQLKERFPGIDYKRGIRSTLLKNENLPREYGNDDVSYIFKLGYYPPQRQMFYQLCDLHVPEIQETLQNFPDKAYDNKFGWLTEQFCDDVRKTIDKCILQALTAPDNSDNSDAQMEENFLSQSVQMKSSDEELSELEDTCFDVDEDDEDINSYSAS